MKNSKGGYEVTGHIESIADVILDVLGWSFNYSNISSRILF